MKTAARLLCAALTAAASLALAAVLTGSAAATHFDRRGKVMQDILPAGTPAAEVSRAEQVMTALAQAYPRLIREVSCRDGDWALLLRGQWFYYADGRLMPEQMRSKAAAYAPQPFYYYPEALSAWKKPLPEDSARLAETAKRRREGSELNRSLFFYDALWNIHSRAEAWEQVKTLRFLGKNVLVHHGILEPLALVEQKIQAAARQDGTVRDWIKEINTVTGWSWRDIADSKTRSNHAYGIAVDILPAPKVYRLLETYWLWTAGKTAEWWNIPYTKRYHPPEAVIRIFESYGFVWGGKWAFYDTMHFEYRPEILILNGITLSEEY